MQVGAITRRPDSALDTLELTRVGRAAQQLLADSTRSVGEQFAGWGTRLLLEFLHLLPHLLVALAAATLILGVTMWLRRRFRARADDGATRATAVGILGILLAALVASELVGATSIAAALLTFALFYAVAVAVRVLTPLALGRWHAAPEAIDLLLTVVRYALLTLGTVEALAALGLRVGGVIAGLGILGLALGFAAQDALANLIAGFIILWDRPIRVGDWVTIGDATGRVRGLTLRSTRVETRDAGVLVIPNKDIVSGTLHNFSLRPLSRVRVPVGVGYDTDIDAARRTMLALLPDLPVVSRAPEPQVAVTALGDSAVVLELIFYITDPREAPPLQWQLNEQILVAFRAAGISIPFPQRDVHLVPPPADATPRT